MIKEKQKVGNLSDKLESLLEQDWKHSHPSEIAGMLNNIPLKSSIIKFNELTQDVQLSIFNYLGFYLQRHIIDALPKDKAAWLLNHLNSNTRNYFFIPLKGIKRSEFLELLDEKNRKLTEDMLGYHRDSVARLINTSFCTLSPEMTIEEAMGHLRLHHEDNDAANTIYISDQEGKLLGAVPIRKLILNNNSKTIGDIMNWKYLKLNIDDTIEEAISRFKQYDKTVLPVTNAENILLGIVMIDDVLDIVEHRNTKEMQQFGGTQSLEFPYVKTTLFSMIKRRAGWLIILFLGEMLTATAMGYFEEEIAAAVVLALFVPLIISSGGNSGSQAATIIIRALAVRELTVKSWWYVMRRELLSGLLLGIIIGSIGFIRITAWQKLGWYDYGPHWLLIAITIFLSLIGIIMWGTLSGSMIPIALKKLKQDPAVSSAPFVATLVDVTGLIIYFTIAAVLLKGTLL